MQIASLGSGSKGNATLIDDGETCIIIDLGFTLKETVRRLARLGKSPEDIDAILVTHEHADHIQGVSVFGRKYKTPVYLTPGTHNPERMGAVPDLNYINCHRNFSVGSLGVEPVPVPHDAREPCQYVVSSNGFKVGVLTDLGHITPFVEQQYHRCDALLLECNHDMQMLDNGPYPWQLKKRVGGMHGHLNNEQAAQLLLKIDLSKLQHLIISHISEKNNSIELALKAMNSALDPLAAFNGNLVVARQDEGFGWLEVK
ncbi:MBL fold metallo-hydrolase [Pseudomonadales bacterium]|nr:MBL fold metallo-hydrolase [Gammaproteobacteria bacterium]MBT3734818.1 MBL fold metallo-hydrolase [Gammaproteobacteria bacterium]MBT7539912.1 MBL fold metallo-hydrolase [Gammaproteobacteria bacterium]MDA7727052.1 MBL fold metallo-hydrolase [Pseudomonadales bacterium]MDC1478971.1 MBL fold metallo-hydrolase [Pseudomonadales bacterium]